MSFCVAGVALRGIPTCVTTRQYVVLCGRRNTFATSSGDVLHYSWQSHQFGHLRCHFLWQAQHFGRVVLHVFSESHCQRCTKWWQGANSVAGVAFCNMSWKSTENWHERRFCSRCIRKLVEKRWFWHCEVWKLPCLWEKSQKHVFFDVSEDVLLSFCVAGVALCDIPRVWGARLSWGWSCRAYHVILRGRRGTRLHSTCVRCKTVVRLKLPCLWERSHKRAFFDVSQDVLMSFCVAGVALCDIPLVWGARLSWGWSCRAYGKGRTNVPFSTCHKMCSCHFAWQAWH